MIPGVFFTDERGAKIVNGVVNIAFDLPAVGRGKAIGDLHLHHRPQIVDLQKNALPIRQQRCFFHLQRVIPLLVGITHRPMARAVIGGPAIIPFEHAPVIGIRRRLGIERAGEADLQAVGVNVQR